MVLISTDDDDFLFDDDEVSLDGDGPVDPTLGETMALFRRYRDSGRPFVLLPQIPADRFGLECLTYEPGGVARGVLYRVALALSAGITRAECADLAAEVEAGGLTLIEGGRVSKKVHNKRRVDALAATSEGLTAK
jgi:hypothetical protein